MKLGYILAAWLLALLVVAILLIFHVAPPSVVSSAYTALTLIALAILGLHRRFRLLRAIRLIDPELRDRITYVPWLGSQGANTMRADFHSRRRCAVCVFRLVPQHCGHPPRRAGSTGSASRRITSGSRSTQQG